MMSYKEQKKKLMDAISRHHDELEGLSDDLTDHPELSAQEFRSSKQIVALLRRHGFTVEYPFDKTETAFRGIAGGSPHTHKVALLTEYDALPDIGHACGHSLSGSISCLAALALQEVQEELDLEVHVIGTPAEETIGYKAFMADHGVFDAYDLAIMVHLYNQNLVTPKLLALDSYFYEFHGKAAHGAAAPWMGVNAFNAAQLQFHAIDMMRQHLKADARIHGIIRYGGEAANVVPDYVKSEIYVRAAKSAYRDEIVEKVDRMADGAAIATGCTWNKYREDHPYDDLKRNETGDATLREVYAELDIPINGDEEALFGSSDIGNVSYRCPAFHPCLQITPLEVPIHSKGFADAVKSNRAHRTLDQGAAVIALQVLKIIGDPARLQALKRDFAKA